MAAASVNRPGSAQTTEKSQLILKGNSTIFPGFASYDVTIQICSFHWHLVKDVLKQDVQVFHRTGSTRIFSKGSRSPAIWNKII